MLKISIVGSNGSRIGPYLDAIPTTLEPNTRLLLEGGIHASACKRIFAERNVLLRLGGVRKGYAEIAPIGTDSSIFRIVSGDIIDAMELLDLCYAMTGAVLVVGHVYHS